MLTKNVRNLFGYQALAYLFFDRAIFTIFLAQQGVSLAQIGVLQAVLWGATFVAEVPMGFLGDRIGRKPLVIGGRALIVIYSLIMAAAGPEWTFFVAFALFGVGEAAVSGADVSLLYENARREGHKGDFAKLAGRFSSISRGALTVAILVGGYLQIISWPAVFLATAGVNFLGMLLMSRVDDFRGEEEHETFRGMAKEISAAFRAEPTLLQFVAGATLLGATSTTLFIFMPVLLEERGASIAALGILMTVVSGAGALSALGAWRAVRITGDKAFFIIVPLICIGFMALLPQGGWIVLGALMVALTFFQELLDPVISRILNDRVSDRIRSSVLSLYSAAFSLVAVIMFPVAGWVGDAYSTATMLYVLAGLCVPAVVLLARVPKTLPASDVDPSVSVGANS